MREFGDIRMDPSFRKRIPKDLVVGAKVLKKLPIFRDICGSYIWKRTEIHKDFPLSSRLIGHREGTQILQYIVYLNVMYKRGLPAKPNISNVHEFNRKRDLVSHNSVNSLINVAEHAGYIKRVQNVQDKRESFLHPTQLLNEAVKAYAKANILPLFQFDLLPKVHLQLLHSDALIDDLVINSVENFEALAVIGPSFPDLKGAMQLRTGFDTILLLFGKFIAGGPALSLPYDIVSSNLGVSRNHLRNIVERLENANLLEVTGRGGKSIEVRPVFVETVGWYLALMFAGNLSVVTAALKRHPNDPVRPG